MPWWGWGLIVAAFAVGGLVGAAVTLIVSAPKS
jgi:hypothetical protein